MGNGPLENFRNLINSGRSKDSAVARRAARRKNVLPGSPVESARPTTQFVSGTPLEETSTPRMDFRSAKRGSSRRPVRLAMDVPLLLVTSTLIIAGLLMVFSASWEYSFVVDGSPTRIFLRQLTFLGAGSLVAVFLAWFDYHHWQKLAVPLMLVSMVALAGVLFMGDERHGAVRSLTGGSIQPSEAAKLVIVIYLSVWLYAKRDQLSEVGFGLFPLSGILGIFGGLIYLQPDLSAVITIILLGGILFFLAGADMRQITILVVLTVIIGSFIVFFSATGSDRWGSFVPGLKDPTQASYHVRRSFEAFVKGGWFGVGIGKADTKLTGLPVPHTDSIFAVVGEETGVVGSVAMVSLFGLLLWRGLIIARRAPDGMGALLASGVTVWLALEAFVNMGVMVGLLPFAGNALPFISAGGSNLMVSLAAIGILFNISRLSEKSKDEQERSFSAVVNLRGRDWRRRVSSPRRTSGPY
jgi:cell division protein FtsW